MAAVAMQAAHASTRVTGSALRVDDALGRCDIVLERKRRILDDAHLVAVLPQTGCRHLASRSRPRTRRGPERRSPAADSAAMMTLLPGRTRPLSERNRGMDRGATGGHHGPGGVNPVGIARGRERGGGRDRLRQLPRPPGRTSCQGLARQASNSRARPVVAPKLDRPRPSRRGRLGSEWSLDRRRGAQPDLTTVGCSRSSACRRAHGSSARRARIVTLAVRVDHEQNILAVALSDRAAKDDEPLLGERVHEGGVPVPSGLLAPSPTRVIPRRTLRALDQVVVGHGGAGYGMSVSSTDGPARTTPRRGLRRLRGGETKGRETFKPHHRALTPLSSDSARP